MYETAKKPAFLCKRSFSNEEITSSLGPYGVDIGEDQEKQNTECIARKNQPITRIGGILLSPAMVSTTKNQKCDAL